MLMRIMWPSAVPPTKKNVFCRGNVGDLFRMVLTERLRGDNLQPVPNPLMEYFSFEEAASASCRQCQKIVRPKFDENKVFFLSSKVAWEFTLQQHISTISDAWAQTMLQHPDGKMVEYREVEYRCDVCKKKTPHALSRTMQESCRILVINIKPRAFEVTTKRTGPIWGVNKMDCSKRFRCGLWDYDPVALFIDNCDIRAKHLSYSVLVRYEKLWFSVNGDAVTHVPSVGKDVVVMVWAVRVEKREA